jgi:drug/metabolite transporter (DMT)-like permease
MTRTRTRRGLGGDLGAEAMVVVAAVAWGTVGIAGRLADDAGIGPVSATAGRTTIAAVALLPLVAGCAHHSWALVPTVLAYGLFFAASRAWRRPGRR